MKATKEMKSLQHSELKVRLEEFKKELLKHHVKAASGASAVNPGKFKQTKKNIARVLTLMNQKRV
jgi:ribosomal protein L29